MYKVFIDGKDGTTGLQIYERIKERADIELLTIKNELRKDISERKRLINQSDITFLCLPDSAAVQSVSLAENPKTRIIDASTAHRTRDDWAYGLPELSNEHRQKIANSKRVAVTGCHASGANVLLYPLLTSGIIGADYPFTINSITGYSGGGNKMIGEYESADKDNALNSPRHYALSLQHKHLREINKVCGLISSPIFVPTVANFYSGMCVTVPIYRKLLSKDMDIAALKEFYKSVYNSKVISVMDESLDFLAANYLSGSDSMKIHISGNDEQILLSALYDNLGKGASGAAMQCMNIMLGIDETESLKI